MVHTTGRTARLDSYADASGDAAADARGNGDFPNHFREGASALGVGRCLLVLDCRPLGMP